MKRKTIVLLLGLIASVMFGSCGTGSNATAGNEDVKYSESQNLKDMTTEEIVEDEITTFVSSSESDSVESSDVSENDEETSDQNEETLQKSDENTVSSDDVLIQDTDVSAQNEELQGMKIEITNMMEKEISGFQVQAFSKDVFGDNILEQGKTIKPAETMQLVVPDLQQDDSEMYNVLITYTDGNQDEIPMVMLLDGTQGTIQFQDGMTLIQVNDTRMQAENPPVSDQEVMEAQEAAKKAIAQATAEDIENDVK